MVKEHLNIRLNIPHGPVCLIWPCLASYVRPSVLHAPIPGPLRGENHLHYHHHWKPLSDQKSSWCCAKLMFNSEVVFSFIFRVNERLKSKRTFQDWASGFPVVAIVIQLYGRRSLLVTVGGNPVEGCWERRPRVGLGISISILIV